MLEKPSVNQQGHLEIGGVDAVWLSKTYGTPLYIYDVRKIREKAAAFQAAFADLPVRYQVAYASKAFSMIAMIQLVDELGLALDVVSGGELYTALRAGFPAERIHFHGNNKSLEELRYAVRENIGAIVVDNFYELELLKTVSREIGKPVNILLRLTPGVDADTHAYISTGQDDSKFGFYLSTGDARKAYRAALTDDRFHLVGLHFHIGSQLFTPDAHVLAVQRLYKELEQWKAEFGWLPNVLNVGGGFGIAYTDGDEPTEPRRFIRPIVEAMLAECRARSLEVPEIWIEPGRAIVGEAGTTLYTIGSRKTTSGQKTFIAVDGGMTDNLRPALYQSKYEAIIANRADQTARERVTIAGKCCESGDILIEDIDLPEARPGDILAVFCTGAYGYAMANNYNRLPRPAVVFVEDGEARLVVERETFEDLIRHDLPLRDPARSRS